MKHTMKTGPRRWAGLAVLVLLGVCLTGCEPGTDAPVFADISGKWTGVYTYPGRSEQISALIRQNGSSLVIETSKSGVAHFFSGTISSDGWIEVVDHYNNKTWTSLGTITSTHVFIRDYLLELYSGTGNTPEQNITLDR